MPGISSRRAVFTASRSASGPKSAALMWPTLPAAMSSAAAVSVASIGVLGSSPSRPSRSMRSSRSRSSEASTPRRMDFAVRPSASGCLPTFVAITSRSRFGCRASQEPIMISLRPPA